MPIITRIWVNAISIFTFFSCSCNVGRRLGGDPAKTFPENTREGLERFLELFSSHPGFLYLEMDIRESADRRLYIFQNREIIPNRLGGPDLQPLQGGGRKKKSLLFPG